VPGRALNLRCAMLSCSTAQKTMETLQLSLNLEIRYVVVLTFNLDSHANISSVCLYVYVCHGWMETDYSDGLF
jgi:nucleoside permease NupC